MKKLSAALLAVVMMITMMSCIVVNVSAEPALGGPAAIEQVKVGLDVSGVDLDTDCMVVSSAWSGLAEGTQVNVKLNGTLYKAQIGRNAFNELATAVSKASAGANIYLTAGVYGSTVEVKMSGLNIYGPYAGISPNAVADATNPLDLAEPNPNRPAASNINNTTDEAVLNCQVNIYQAGANLNIDGVTIGRNGFINLNEGAKDRYGTHLSNSIVNTSKADLFMMGRGRNFNFLVENNRVVSAQRIVQMGGMGDITLRSNYFNTNAPAIFATSLAAGSMGLPVLVENNYWENCNGIFTFDPASFNTTANYSVTVKNNHVANMQSGYVVHNEYLALMSAPGINIHVTGNTILGIKNVPFYFPYVESANASILARYLVNINENYFEIPKSVPFIDSAVNATLNCANNYYTSEMTVDRVIKYKDSTLVLCPYYEDLEMTKLVGGASINGINLDSELFGVKMDEPNKKITIDFRGHGLDCFDLSDVIMVSEGCSWKMYKSATLAEEVKGSTVYFDGSETVRYVAVTSADGISTSIYRLYLINDVGTEAKLLDVVFDSTAVPAPVVSGTHYLYNLNSETALLNCDLMVSNGATYTFWEDSQCQDKPIDAIETFIPCSDSADESYIVYVKIVSEDGNSTGKYTLEFVRPRSANYDPGVLSVTTPFGNSAVRNSRKMIYYYCTGISGKETFDFELTPGASYAIYSDAACTKLLSAQDNIKSLPLKEGQNTFYVKVKDAKNENVYTLVVENGVRSADNVITGMDGASSLAFAENTILAGAALSDMISATFITSSPYATVTVYADEARELPLEYTSTPVTENGRTVDQRSFDLDSSLPINVYYVVCKAENGATRTYTLQIQKTVFANTFTDVKENDWFNTAVTKASALGVMNGSKIGADADGNELYKFRPRANITRQEVATLICNMVGSNPAYYGNATLPFTDKSKVASWAEGFVKTCYQNGYMEGNNRNEFRPTAYITRQELMSIIARVYDLNGTADLSAFSDRAAVADWAKADVEACVAAGIISGSNGKLNPKAYITRAEVASIVTQIDANIGLY